MKEGQVVIGTWGLIKSSSGFVLYADKCSLLVKESMSSSFIGQTCIINTTIHHEEHLLWNKTKTMNWTFWSTTNLLVWIYKGSDGWMMLMWYLDPQSHQNMYQSCQTNIFTDLITQIDLLIIIVLYQTAEINMFSGISDSCWVCFSKHLVSTNLYWKKCDDNEPRP